MLYAGLIVAEEPENSETGQKVFNTCAVCHLQSGEGVIGVFPPLRNRLASIASSALGREYLISVVLKGMNGPMVFDGVSYQSYMQAYQGTLQDEQISAVLNYIATQVSDEVPVNFSLFSAEEVAQAKLGLTLNATSSLEKRKQLGLK